MRKFILLGLFSVAMIGILYSCQSAEQVQQDTYYVNGRDIYLKHCQNCHGEKGEGLGKLTPPLTDSVFMKANKTKLACFIKNGLSTPITVHGQVYEDKMPPFNMADIDIAQVIVYITNGFGHKQGMYTNEQVANDLKDCK